MMNRKKNAKGKIVVWDHNTMVGLYPTLVIASFSGPRLSRAMVLMEAPDGPNRQSRLPCESPYMRGYRDTSLSPSQSTFSLKSPSRCQTRLLLFFFSQGRVVWRHFCLFSKIVGYATEKNPIVNHSHKRSITQGKT